MVEDDLKNTETSVHDVQAILLNLFSADTVLTGYNFQHSLFAIKVKNYRLGENQDGSVGRHTAPPCTTRTDRKSNGKEVHEHQGNKK